MNRSTEQALISLIPRLNGSLPDELVQLAGSLIAQSRNRAGNLKAEEEIGRIYACANIACERLKQSLDLPPIEPRPPCPPRIYKMLYDYLNTCLAPLKRTRSAANTPTKPLPTRPTPTKESTLAQFRTATPTRTPTRAKRTTLKHHVPQEIPMWIAPVIRRLCKELQAPAAIPSVIAGVTSILTLPSPVPSERGKYLPGSEEEAAAALPEFKTPALIAMVFFFVKTKLLGKEIGGKDYGEAKKLVLSILEKARQDGELKSVLAKKVPNDREWMSDWVYISKKDIDTWLSEIAGKGWLELDWFTNVPAGGGLHDSNGEGAIRKTHNEPRRKSVSKDFLQAGLGTMMQDRVDYLSDVRRQEYKAWSEAVLSTISELRRARDVDVEMQDV